jgi:hypothetical protein
VAGAQNRSRSVVSVFGQRKIRDIASDDLLAFCMPISIAGYYNSFGCLHRAALAGTARHAGLVTAFRSR